MIAGAAGGGNYNGEFLRGDGSSIDLDISAFVDSNSKNATDLVTYAIHAWESGWGYVWGTYKPENPRVTRGSSGDNTEIRRNLSMEHNDKIKKAFWITEDMDREIDAHLKQDNCSSRSEFVMNALKFYVGYLNTKNASAFLPEVLSATLTGTLDGFAGRISSLLFKQGVDINLMAQIIAYDTDIDEGAYERLRGKAIRDMNRTNGRISFKDALDFQKSV